MTVIMQQYFLTKTISIRGIRWVIFRFFFYLDRALSEHGKCMAKFIHLIDLFELNEVIFKDKLFNLVGSDKDLFIYARNN